MQDLNDLYLYAQVVDHGGFAAAGRALGIPKSRLSRRVAVLEKGLGVRLLQRSTRRFAVTDIGRTYYAHCKAMLVEAEAAQDAIEVTRAEPCGTVRLTCPVALLDLQVGDMLATFMAQHPRVDVVAEATNRRVDVIAEAVDIAIRVRPPPLSDSDLQATPRDLIQYVLYDKPAREQQHRAVAALGLEVVVGPPGHPPRTGRQKNNPLAMWSGGTLSTSRSSRKSCGRTIRRARPTLTGVPSSRPRTPCAPPACRSRFCGRC